MMKSLQTFNHVVIFYDPYGGFLWFPFKGSLKGFLTKCRGSLRFYPTFLKCQGAAKEVDLVTHHPGTRDQRPGEGEGNGREQKR